MQRGRYYLTEAGRDLLAFCQTGVELRFTKVSVGDGTITSTEELLRMTELKHELYEATMTGIKANGDGTSTISVSLSNDGVKEGFLLKELGLYAQDPRKGEILYAVAYYDQYSDYIPVHNQEMVEIMMDIIVVVSNVENVTINIDRSMTFVTWEEYWDLAGRGRTTQTVKGNWDLIQDLKLQLAAQSTQLGTGVNTNRFQVQFKLLTGEEEFEGIYDPKMARFVI